MQCWTNVENVGPTLYKCYTNVLCLLGCRRTFSQTLYIYSTLVQCWASVADVGLTVKQHWINVSFELYLVISSVAILLPSICTQKATVDLHLTVPGMRVLQLDDPLILSNVGHECCKVKPCQTHLQLYNLIRYW